MSYFSHVAWWKPAADYLYPKFGVKCSSRLPSTAQTDRKSHRCNYHPTNTADTGLANMHNKCVSFNYLDFFVVRLYSMNLYLLCCSSSWRRTASADLFSLWLMYSSTSSCVQLNLQYINNDPDATKRSSLLQENKIGVTIICNMMSRVSN